MTKRSDWESLARRVHAEHREFRDAVAEIGRFAREYESRMENRLNDIANVVDIVRRCQSSVASDWNRLREALWEARRLDVERFRKSMEAAARRRKKVLVEFAGRGWYLDPKLPVTAPEQLLKALREDEDGSVAEAIEDYFEERVDQIEQALVLSFPGREAVLRDAFEAHRTAKYNLSVPVFLAQADGMWWDRFRLSLFAGRDRQRVASSEMPSDNSFDGAMAEVFRAAIPLWLPRNQREEGFDEFNRHQVMHGESARYGTRTNSLKAISFLAFLQFLLKSVDDEEE